MTAPKIEKLLTPYNFTNANNVGRIKYIVIHYVGALGGAWANCHYYASKYLGASAHYFVGFEGEIWQSVEDEDIAWHCGAKNYKHAECRNSNSIGIELCVRNKGSQADTSKDWYFEDSHLCNVLIVVGCRGILSLEVVLGNGIDQTCTHYADCRLHTHSHSLVACVIRIRTCAEG